MMVYPRFSTAQRLFAKLFVLILAAGTAALAGCGSSSGGGGGGGVVTHAPVISNLQFSPTTASVGDGGGSFVVNGTLDVTDSGGDIATFEVTTYDSAGNPVGTLSTPIPGLSGVISVTLGGSITFNTSAAGVFTYKVNVIDAAGSASNTLQGTFTVTPLSGTPYVRQIGGVMSGGGSSSEWGRAIATDNAGNIYVTGQTYGSLPGSPTPNPPIPDTFLLKYNSAGDNVWTRQIGSPYGNAPYGVAVDTSGNIYVAGATSGTIPGSPTPHQGSNDLFLVKYNSAGDNVWTREMGTPTNDTASCIAVDSAGNVYVAGWTDGTLPGSSTANQGGLELFLVKYNSAGDNVWTRQMGATDDVYVEGVAVDNTGNIYVTGSTYGTLSGSPTTNRGSSDFFLVKFNPAGDNVWTRQMGSPTSDTASGIAVDSAGNVYVAGYTGGTLPGSPTTSQGWGDLFLVKYNSAGDNVWTRQMGSTFSSWAQSVAVDAAGDIYVAGGTQGTFPGSPTMHQGGDDILLVKYNSAGDNVWTRQMGSSADDDPWAVAVDTAGNVYITGETQGSLDGTPKVGSDYDIFVLKYLPDGTGP